MALTKTEIASMKEKKTCPTCSTALTESRVREIAGDASASEAFRGSTSMETLRLRESQIREQDEKFRHFGIVDNVTPDEYASLRESRTSDIHERDVQAFMSLGMSRLASEAAVRGRPQHERR
jgi:hypothetical protein